MKDPEESLDEQKEDQKKTGLPAASPALVIPFFGVAVLGFCKGIGLSFLDSPLATCVLLALLFACGLWTGVLNTYEERIRGVGDPFADFLAGFILTGITFGVAYGVGAGVVHLFG